PDGDRKHPETSARYVLGEQLSASLRESLIEQLAAIHSADEAAAWAHRNLPAKNKLAAADAKMVEERFQVRLLQIDRQETVAPDGPPHPAPTQSHAAAGVVATPTTRKAIAGTAPVG